MYWRRSLIAFSSCWTRLQGQQVPFSLVGIVGLDLFGEFLPLADGGQVIASVRRPASPARGRSRSFRSASLPGSVKLILTHW